MIISYRNGYNLCIQGSFKQKKYLFKNYIIEKYFILYESVALTCIVYLSNKYLKNL